MFEGKLSDMDIITLLPEVFAELHEEDGTYARLNQDEERMCSIASLLNVIWLLKGNYLKFVESQPEASRMGAEQWVELQRFVKWTNMSMDTIHAVLTFLAIRGLPQITQFLCFCCGFEGSTQGLR